MGPELTLRETIAAELDAAAGGDPGALDRLVPLMYDELRAIAHRQLRRRLPGTTLQTTALVHEAYLRLAGSDVAGRGRAYFFATVSRAMRQVLVDRSRARSAAKRGGGAQMITLGEEHASVDGYALELIALDEALRELSRRNPRQAQVIECRFFGGMSVDDTAEVLGVSPRTVDSDWALARAWLFTTLDAIPSARDPK